MQTSAKVCTVVFIWSATARTLGSLLDKISCLLRFWLISYFACRGHGAGNKPNGDPLTLTKHQWYSNHRLTMFESQASLGTENPEHCAALMS